jgi:hypothetical protein
MFMGAVVLSFWAAHTKATGTHNHSAANLFTALQQHVSDETDVISQTDFSRFTEVPEVGHYPVFAWWRQSVFLSCGLPDFQVFPIALLLFMC